VEEKLPLLIQKLLEAQIKRHPPVFPWEKEITQNDAIEPEFGHPKPNIPASSPPIIDDRDIEN
jgi:hypothetical protein